MNKAELGLLRRTTGGEPIAGETKAQFGKWKVSWQDAENAKSDNGRRMFWVPREKFCLWIHVGSSKAFTDQVISEIATKIAQKKIQDANDPLFTEEQVKKHYLHQLKNLKSLDFLKVEGDAYVVDIDNVVAKLQEESVKAAILSLNEKYLNKIGKSLPTSGSEEKEFIKSFLENSEVFTEDDSEVIAKDNPALSHQEIEDQLLQYISELGEEGKKFRLDEEEYTEIISRRSDEDAVIENLSEQFEQDGIEPEVTRKIIELWQTKTGYKKEVNENEDAVKKVIKQACKDGDAAVHAVFTKLPERKSDEEMVDYKNRLIATIDKKLEGNDAAKLTYKGMIDSFQVDDAERMVEEIKLRNDEINSFPDYFVGHFMENLKSNEVIYLSKLFKAGDQNKPLWSIIITVYDSFRKQNETVQMYLSGAQKVSFQDIKRAFWERLQKDEAFSNAVAVMEKEKKKYKDSAVGTFLAKLKKYFGISIDTVNKE